MTEETATIRVTKFDAAIRQLRTAVELWFADGDPISIHALAFAAHEIIHRLYRAQGLSDLMFDTTVIKDEHRADYAKMLKVDATFFKHADKDLAAVREFNPYANVLFLFMSAIGLQHMGHRDDTVDAFLLWSGIQNPHWFDPAKVREYSFPVERFEKLRALDKSDFFKAFLELRRERRAAGKI